MSMPVYVTGNEHKARLFNEMVGIELSHERADVLEIQSLDLREVVEYKAKEAYRLLQKPVIVEDTQLQFTALGRLPGPLIKWFLEELGNDGLCKLADTFADRSAVAACSIAYFDGSTLQVFERQQRGRIARQPGKGTSGFGWDAIFIPNGQELVRSDMDEQTYKQYYAMTKPFTELAAYLKRIDKA